MKIDSKKLHALITEQGYTNAQFAQEAGLSRQALQAILRQDRPEVRATTVEKLTRALKLPDASALGEDSLAGYKALVAEEQGYLDFRGLGLPATEPRLLDDLFIPVRVRRKAEPSHDKGCPLAPCASGAELAEPSLAEEDAGELPLSECLVQDRRVLLRGDPGGGKTTALRHLARSSARGRQKEDGSPFSPLTPLFVRLTEYAKAREQDGDLSLVRFVVARSHPEGTSGTTLHLERLLEEELRRGDCLVLLDGLDEVGRDGSLHTALHDLIAGYPDNQFILSSRVVGLDSEPWTRLGFTTYDLAPWQEKDIRAFTLRWYASLHRKGGVRQRKEAERRAKDLSAAILASPAVRAMATNPLTLTLLAALHHGNATLPRRRVDLYAKVVDVLLETWEAAKRDARPGDLLHGIALEPREFGWLLSRLALEMQRQDRVLSPRWWVTEFVQQFLRDSLALPGTEAKEQGDRVIRYLCEHSGLLVERGAEVFGFSHRTFHEYFAARAIVEGGEGDPVRLLQPYLFHPRWKQVVRLVGAQLPPTRATALIRLVLDDPDPAGRFLRRGLRLALRCLVEGAAVSERRLLDEIFSAGDVLGRSPWLGITLDVIAALLALKTTRHASDASRMLQQIESAARQVLPKEDYIAIYLRIHGPPVNGAWANDLPGTVHRKRLAGGTLTIVSSAPRLRQESPADWYAAVLRVVRDSATTPAVKQILINDLLRFEVDSNEQVRAALEEVLASDRIPSVRAASADALSRAARSHTAAADRLLRSLEQDSSTCVRAACASALGEAAAFREDVRTHLKHLFSSAPEEVRAGAVRGLYRVAQMDRPFLDSLVGCAPSPREAPQVRVACLHVLAGSLGEGPAVTDCLTECVEDPTVPLVQRVAAQLIAEALAEDRWPWSSSQVADVEAILMAVPTPCPHALDALERLVSAKEVHGGTRLEQVLSDALAPFGDRVSLAFVFGSVARGQQGQESDIDLLIIGDVRLKEVVAGLHAAEQGLGRIINPALYTPASFREKYQAGDPFLLEVVRNDKLFLKGTRDELTGLVAERVSQDPSGDRR